VTFKDKSAGPLSWLRHPRTTVRWRLTLLYGGLFLVCGAGLLAITYTLVEHATVTPTRGAYAEAVTRPNGPAQWKTRPGATLPPRLFHNGIPPQVRKVLNSKEGPAVIQFVSGGQRFSDLHQLIVESSIALAIMALISAGLGWVVAGRVLSPLRTITTSAQHISEANLHERLAMEGPRDELRTLADTIDGLLERLEGAFDAQRRFVANASHELRTPLTTARALLEMALSDPDATVDSYRETCRHVLEESAQQEQLIDALLALAQGQRGIDRRDPVDLAAVAGHVLQAKELETMTQGLALDVRLDPALIAGDERLIERLVSNLVDNAIRHNEPHGWVEVRVGARAGKAALLVANTGSIVPPNEVDRLLQPFQRLAADRVGRRDGLGLGLSIVGAIATAHDADLDVHSRAEGGLAIEVRFPRVPDKIARRAKPYDQVQDLQPVQESAEVQAPIRLST
jgi:signal transduction histidine kinase